MLHNYFPHDGLYFHPDTIDISPPADGNQNVTSVGLRTDLLSFLPLAVTRKVLVSPACVLATVIREVAGARCVYLSKSS